jgi:hypothetical protein
MDLVSRSTFYQIMPQRLPPLSSALCVRSTVEAVPLLAGRVRKGAHGVNSSATKKCVHPNEKYTIMPP